ncbi:hypothetical protein [Acinetobacter harbinensis]|jgi:hypothetical protein|uniref:hypothetical protein n=1 Tax=Acinetobacter harbinensis TaxID=1353941 RepID=UPI001C4F3C64|nr:hypothetical protein [Acinetobacter harbinensis]
MDDLDIDLTSHLGFQTTAVFNKFVPKTRKTWVEVFKGSPHLAVTEKEARKWQWLSNGYYFWLNADRFAHWWGKLWFKQYAITKYTIKVDRTQLLDLITNPDHIQFFWDLMNEYQKVYDQAVEAGEAEELIEPSVCAVLTYFRDLLGDGFQYKAIMAIDEWKDFKFLDPNSDFEFKMAPDSNQHEIFGGTKRAQICVFEQFGNDILFKKTAHFPEKYVMACCTA